MNVLRMSQGCVIKMLGNVLECDFNGIGMYQEGVWKVLRMSNECVWKMLRMCLDCVGNLLGMG